MSTPTTALPVVQKAVYGLLSSDSQLVGKLAGGASGVVDAVTDSQAFPYVVIGDATEIPWNTQEHKGRELTCTFDVWSDAKGFAQAEGILDDLNRLLDEQSGIPLTGASWIWSMCEFAEPMRDPDVPRVRHLVARYRIWVQIP